MSVLKIRVLLVEDFPLVREGVAAALKRDPAIVVVGEAANGREGLQLAHDLRPDVVLLDLHMPELGGMMLLERIRAELPGVRTIVMTASEKGEPLLDAVAAGASGYLTKRASGEELRQAVLTVHGGGSVIAPALAGHLLRAYSRASQRREPRGPLQAHRHRARGPAPRRPGPDGQADRRADLRLAAHGAEPPRADPGQDRPAAALRARPLGRPARGLLGRSTPRRR